VFHFTEKERNNTKKYEKNRKNLFGFKRKEKESKIAFSE